MAMDDIGGATDFVQWLVDKVIFFDEWSTTSWILAAIGIMVLMWLFQWMRMQSQNKKGRRLRF